MQLERNFNAIVEELKRTAGEEANVKLASLMSQLDIDMKNVLLRTGGGGSAQRLEERHALLQRNFQAAVELLSVPPAAPPPPLTKRGTSMWNPPVPSNTAEGASV